MIKNELDPSIFSFHQSSAGFTCRISAPLSANSLRWLKQEIMEEYKILAGDSKTISFVFENHPMSASFLEEMLFLFSALKTSGYEISIKSQTFTPDFQSPEI